MFMGNSGILDIINNDEMEESDSKRWESIIFWRGKWWKSFKNSKISEETRRCSNKYLKDEISHKPIGDGEECIRSNTGQWPFLKS